MSLSWPSSSEASDDLDPFFEDLEAGITKLVNAAANSQLVDKSVWLMLTPNPQLGKNVCWCGEDKEHNFKTCSQRLSTKIQSPPTVSPDARLSPCPHKYDKKNFNHNCFCFQIAGTMKIFHQFFLRPRILAILSPEHKFADSDPVQNLGQGQEDALKNIVDLYNNRVPKSALWVSDNAKYKVLARFLTDMRRKDIVAEAEKDVNFPWHIERVHTILGWRNRGVNECVADLKQAIDEASRHKTSINKSIHDIIVEEDISFNR